MGEANPQFQASVCSLGRIWQKRRMGWKLRKETWQSPSNGFKIDAHGLLYNGYYCYAHCLLMDKII